jgi:hypothetical protein
MRPSFWSGDAKDQLRAQAEVAGACPKIIFNGCENVTFSALRARGYSPTVPIMENTPPMPAKGALAAVDQPAPADVGPPKRISKKGPRRNRRHSLR